MKIYDLLLTTLFLRGVMTKESMLSINSCQRLIYKHIKTAEKKKHIRIRHNGEPREFTDRSGTFINKVYCYEITPDGIRYLIAEKPCPLFNHITIDETKNLRPTKKMMEVSRWELAVIKTNEAATMSALAGADVDILLSYPRYEMKDVERKNQYYSYEELKNLAISRMSDIELKQMKEEMLLSKELYSTFKFTDAKSIKSNAKTNSLSATAKNDFDKCQLGGILRSPIKSVLFYSAFGNYYDWNEWVVKYDIFALNLAIIGEEEKELRENLIKTRFCCALLVRNALSFKKIYFDEANARNGKMLGNKYQHMYILPVTYQGAINLRDDIMFRSDEQTNELFIQGQLNSGAHLITDIDEAKYLAFPVETDEGTRIGYGCIMDVIKFQKMQKEIAMAPDKKFELICYPWQKEYYTAIFNDTIRIFDGTSDSYEETESEEL